MNDSYEIYRNTENWKIIEKANNHEITLKPVEDTVPIAKKGNLTVINVKLENGGNIVQQIRKSRISKITGIPESDL
ncbi:MAG: hypothetical protein HQM10_24830 [Candidatus Riflebacteria bacterium]|nr:hypothetical protein [Candidatus Riflebacteria bacterium]